MEKQIAIIFCGTHGLLAKVPVKRVREFEEEFLDILELKHKDLLDELRKGILKEKEEKVLEKVAREIASRYEETE